MNDNKGIWGILFIIAAVVLGLWWLSSGRGGLVQNEPQTLLDDLKSEVGVEFGNIEASDFDWRLPTEADADSLTVSGYAMEATAISNADKQAVAKFFEDRGFEYDVYNGAAGVVGELEGYVLDDMVCLVETGVTGGEAGLEADPITYDLTIWCGQADLPEVKTDEELIAAAFAEKYDKSVDDIEVTISQRIKVFAKGGVTLDANDPDATGGLFFAFKENNGWTIVWDGNGSIPCEDIDEYDFPVEMVAECVDAAGDLQQR